MDAQSQAWHDRSIELRSEADFGVHWAAYKAAFEGRQPEQGPPIVWTPSPARVARANATALRESVGVADWGELHAWSVANRAAYWKRAIERLGIPFATEPSETLNDGGGPTDPVWLPGARLNISEACWHDPDAPAILAGAEGSQAVRTWSQRELKALAGRVAGGLRRLGLGVGDGVALYMPMNAECVAAYLGIVRAGMFVISIPDSFSAAEVATRLRLGGAKAIITVDAFLRAGKSVAMAPRAREATAGTEVQVVVCGDAGSDVSWDQLLDGPPLADAVSCSPEDTTNVLFSSGTTGEPKAIPWTHLTPIKAAADGHFHQDIHAGDVVAWPTNIGWMMGPWLIYATLANRATIALFEGSPTSPEFISFLQKTKVSMMGVVPAIVRAWREGDIAHPGDLPMVRTFSSTGEASNARDVLYLMSLAGYEAPLIEYCGGTEIGGGHVTGSVLQPASPATFSTPALGMDFVVLDDEAQAVAPGGHGQIYLVPPSIGLSQRLLNRDHDKEYHECVPRGPEGEVLRRHGDEIHVLHGGFWAPGGRADDTMNLGGIKVSSIELEAAMNGHPGVSETAAVASRPAAGGAEQLVVFAVSALPAAELKAALQQRIKERLNPLFRIHEVVVIQALPRTASNKVMRRELRARYEETVAA